LVNLAAEDDFPRFAFWSADRLQFQPDYNRRVHSTRFVFMKSSTRDKIKGAFKEAKGKSKEKAGEATGNPDLRDRGTAEKAGGKVQRKIGDVKKVFEQ
jgi:uncharacterized protein YjbJ (UPF0337 family)